VYTLQSSTLTGLRAFRERYALAQSFSLSWAVHRRLVESAALVLADMRWAVAGTFEVAART
jgi:hypothetical protein